VFLVLRRNFAHTSALRLFDSGLPLERWVDLQETVIDRLLVRVEQDFNRAETFVDRFEQRPVIFFRHAQSFLRLPLLDEISSLASEQVEKTQFALRRAMTGLAPMRRNHADGFPRARD